jgi:methyl-accepting chemotaxis protein
MTTSAPRWMAVLTLCAAALAPARAPAQGRPGAAAAAGLSEGLTPQEKEMLALALDAARRCGEAMEGWIAAREVTAERLFAALYYPVPNTDPPKFTTDWDRLSDRDVQPIQEAVLARSATIVFAVLVDRHGYLPTHNLRYAQPLTGNAATDLVNNRTKRIFNDKTGLSAARSSAPFLIQRYQRDTGEQMVDLSVPVWVKGSHWGAVRIGYRPVEAR